MSSDLNLFGKLPSAEVRLIKAILDTDSDVSLIIPDTVTPDQIMEQLGVLCRAAVQLETTRDKLLPVIGRLLILCQENPETYREANYKDWRAFIRGFVYMKLGMSRSSVYFAMQTAKQWPRLTPQDYGDIGRKNMMVLNAIGSQNGMSSHKLVERAKAMKTDDFREWCVSTGRLERGEERTTSINVICGGNLKNRWERIIRDPEVIKAAASSSPAKILEAMIAEFMVTYGLGEKK